MKPQDMEAQLERLHPDSFGWALSCCGHDETEAEDVLQTTYLKIVSGAARFEGRSSLRTWVFGVIRRTAQEAAARRKTDRGRRLRLLSDEVEGPGSEGSDEALMRKERAEALRRAMKELSPRQREILHLVFYQDLSISEAARIMELSIGSARTHYERAKARLRALLNEDQDVA